MLAWSRLACFNCPAKAKMMSVIAASAMHICLILAEAEITSPSLYPEDATSEVILPVLPTAASLQMPLLQALLCDSHITLLKAEGKVFVKQLQQRAALADLLTAAGSGDATAKSRLSRLTMVYLMSPCTSHHGQVTMYKSPVGMHQSTYCSARHCPQSKTS